MLQLMETRFFKYQISLCINYFATGFVLEWITPFKIHTPPAEDLGKVWGG